MTRFLSHRPTLSYLNEELTGRRGNALTLGAAVYQPPTKAALFGVDPSGRGLGQGPPPSGPEDQDAGRGVGAHGAFVHVTTYLLHKRGRNELSDTAVPPRLLPLSQIITAPSAAERKS